MTQRLTLGVADSMANAAIQTAKKFKFNPVTVVVVDSNGHTLVSKRMDGCSPVAIPQFAHAKALTCIGMKMSSRTFRDRYTNGSDPTKYCQMLSMVSITNGQMAPFPGGILLKAKIDGSVVGSIGVSGAAGDEDEFCAITAAEQSQIADEIEIDPPRHSLTLSKS